MFVKNSTFIIDNFNRSIMPFNDLHDKFIEALCNKVPRRSDLVNQISQILYIEKESASRRLSGRVLFTVKELGILSNFFNISIDNLLNKSEDNIWMSQILEFPNKIKSMDTLCDMIDFHLADVNEITQDPTELGSVYNSLPVEFFIHYPMLTKFMFFKWGHYFIGTEEFYNFSEWSLPPRLASLKDRHPGLSCFERVFYIWDQSLILTLTSEIMNLYQMKAIRKAEKEMLKEELKDLLLKLEVFLKGLSSSEIFNSDHIFFYVSNINIGFTGNYYISENKQIAFFQTNFSYARVDNNSENCILIKDWFQSFRNVSILFSNNAPIERRLFFQRQHEIIDLVLG